MGASKYPSDPRELVMAAEDPAEYEALVRDFYRQYAPAEASEKLLVDELIREVWSRRLLLGVLAQFRYHPNTPRINQVLDYAHLRLPQIERQVSRNIKELQGIQRKRQPKRAPPPAARRPPAPKTSSGEWIN